MLAALEVSSEAERLEESALAARALTVEAAEVDRRISPAQASVCPAVRICGSGVAPQWPG